MRELGKFVVVIGVVVTLVGLVMWSGFAPKWLGRLPGDIRIERDGHFLMAAGGRADRGVAVDTQRLLRHAQVGRDPLERNAPAHQRTASRRNSGG